jgi:hypothetical protein
MVSKLVLHIGDCKTGTTSIQSALRAAETSHPGSGIFFGAAVNHNDLALSLLEDRNEEADAGFEDLARNIMAAPQSTAVLSAEMFEFVDPQRLRQVLEKHLPALCPGARVIAYVRPHSERLLSAFAETVKKGEYFGTLEEYFTHVTDQGDLAYAPRLQRWHRHFGSALIVRPFLPGSWVGGDVVSDFFFHALPGTVHPAVTTHRNNIALCVQDLVLLRMIYQRWLVLSGGNMPSGASSLGWCLARRLVLQPTARPTPLSLSPYLANKLSRACTHDACLVDAMWFSAADGKDSLAIGLERHLATASDQKWSLEADQYYSKGEQRLVAIMADLLYPSLYDDGHAFERAMEQFTTISLPETK